MLKFHINYKDQNSSARVGTIETNHGTVETPAFMPVGTQATVKSLTPDEIKDLGFSMIVVNAYHIYLRPGHHLVKNYGGLHGFMGWDKSIATDSGGFQVLSLSKKRKILDNGIFFQSHIDGSEHLFTPEKSIEIQEYLGSDIMMCLDECPPYQSSYEYIRNSVAVTTRWANQCKACKNNKEAALFGIIQGGIYKDLREKSAQDLVEMDFDGYSVGGLGIGETTEDLVTITDQTLKHVPVDKPRYLMGLGTPVDILELVSSGVDLFDCVIPTRNARNGTLFTSKGKIVIKNAQYKDDPNPIDDSCECYTCKNFSRAYLRHLFMSGELLAYRLFTINNLHYYSKLMKEIRNHIKLGSYNKFKKHFIESGGEFLN